MMQLPLTKRQKPKKKPNIKGRTVNEVKVWTGKSEWVQGEEADSKQIYGTGIT